MKKFRLKVFRLKKTPEKCNILGLSYRSVCILISFVLLLQNLSFIASHILKNKIPCSIFNNGLYSLIIQFGDDYWPLAGLVITILCLLTNSSLLVEAIWRIERLILLWYIGGIVQFVYLLSLQTFCLSTTFCNNNCEMDREGRKCYTWGFGWCLFLTLYFYLTFIFKIHLLYVYVHHQQRPPDSMFSREEVFINTFYYAER